jgi:hypothetical protein
LSNDETIVEDVEAWHRHAAAGHFENGDVTPFTIPVDEPRDAEARRYAKHVAELVQSTRGEEFELLTAVTDAPSATYQNAFDIYLSPDNWRPGVEQGRRDRVSLWTYNGRPPQAGSVIIDTDGVALRTWGWIAFSYGVPLWHAWEGLYFADRYNDGAPTDVFREPLTFDERTKPGGGEDYGNGDGLLAYPGALPSLRLKALRRGLQDRLLLLSLSRCGGGGEARAMASRLVPRALGEGQGEGTWPSHEAPWERARVQLLKRIDEVCHG